jgi:amino acid transporter
MAGRGLGQLFARKSVEQMHAENESGELKKSLGAINLVLLGIGCIIGTGIFVLTGRAAAEFAGPGIMISFVITGTLCALVAICYSELAAAIPVSGSAYSYSYASLGEFVAWIMGVLLLLEYGVAASTVAVGWSGYTTSLLHDLGINLPHALTQAPGVLVATSGIDVMAIDPQVALAGATGVLADGTQVVFDKTAQAVLAGQFPIQVSDYSVVADRLLEVGSANSATLIDGVKATLHTVTEGAATTQQTVDVAANATITFLENSKVSLPSEAIAALAPGQTVGSMVNLPALMGILAVTALLTLGVSESANVNNIVVVIKVTVVVAFIVIGFFYVNPANWSPLIPDQVPAPPPGSDMSVGGQIWSALGNIITGQSRDSAYGVGGLIAAASTIFFAYIGFEAVSTAGAESKNPARDMPIGIIGSLVICTILYILTCAVLVGIVPYYELNDPAPIAKAVEPDRPAVVRLPRESRRLRRPVVGDAGAALWPDPHLLHDGARRPAAERVRQDQPEDPDARAQHDRRRRHRGGLRRVHGSRLPGRYDERRNAGGLHADLRDGGLPALCAAEHEPAVQDADLGDHHHCRAWRHDVLRPRDVADVFRADAELLHSVSDRRHPVLLRLRHVALEAGEGRCRHWA